MKIRPIEEKDNQAMKKILQDNLRAVGLDIPGTAYFDKNLDTLAQFYNQNSQRGYYVLVDDNDKVLGGAGFAEFYPEKKIAELQKVYLAPEARGHGASYQLISVVEKHARMAGYQKLYLETHPKLTAAIHVYRKMNFHKLDAPIKKTAHDMSELYIKDI